MDFSSVFDRYARVNRVFKSVYWGASSHFLLLETISPQEERYGPELQIRGSFEDNSEIFLLQFVKSNNNNNKKKKMWPCIGTILLS